MGVRVVNCLYFQPKWLQGYCHVLQQMPTVLTIEIDELLAEAKRVRSQNSLPEARWSPVMYYILSPNPESNGQTAIESICLGGSVARAVMRMVQK